MAGDRGLCGYRGAGNRGRSGDRGSAREGDLSLAEGADSPSASPSMGGYGGRPRGLERVGLIGGGDVQFSRRVFGYFFPLRLTSPPDGEGTWEVLRGRGVRG